MLHRISPHGVRSSKQAVIFAASMCLILVGSAVTLATPHKIAATSPSQAAPGIQHLEPGEPIERDLAGGQSHSYLIKAPAAQYMWITVEQKRINAVVSAFDPAGKKILEADIFGVETQNPSGPSPRH